MLKVAVTIKFYKGEISPFDEACVETALKIDNAEIYILSMGPIDVKEKLQYFTRFGNIHAILISDNCFAGSDTLATAKVLTTALKKISPDIVLCGRQSLNGDTAQVPAQIASMLNFNFYPYVLNFSLNAVQTRLGNSVVSLPAVFSLERVDTLRFASIFSQKKEVKVWNNDNLLVDRSRCGLSGSFTKVIRVVESEKKERKCEFLRYEELDGIIKKSLKEDSDSKNKKYNFIVKEKIDKVAIVGDGLSDVEHIAKEVIRIPFTDIEETVKKIKTTKVKYILLSAGLKNRVLAPQLAVKLDCGLCADCIGIQASENELHFLRPANCNNVVAEIKIDGKYAMATIREKEDNSGKVIFGIGYGAKDKIDYIMDLARKYNAEIVASRKVVDEGLILYEKQVGLTGKIISPEVYVAWGISGEIQHIVGIEGANTIIAINKDKESKIFSYSDYGIIYKI